MITGAMRSIFSVNLGVSSAERVLVFTDKPTGRETLLPEDAARRERLRDLAMLAAETGRALAGEIVECVYPATGAHGKEPPRSIWEAAFGERAVRALEGAGLLRGLLAKRIDDAGLLRAEQIVRGRAEDAVNAIVALSNYSTSHTRFRDFLTRLTGARYASMPLFDVTMLEGPMAVDYKTLARRTEAAARALRRAVRVEIATPNGTAIAFSTLGRPVAADTGIITQPGAFGNLPAGEAYLAPVEGTASGRLVLEFAPTRPLSKPITLTIKDGLVTGVSGSDPFAIDLERKLTARRQNRNIAELGIGTNDRARRPDNILESEKILGTLHIALGDNSSFGGSVQTPFHQDFVFFQPTLTMFDRHGSPGKLLDRGKLLV